MSLWVLVVDILLTIPLSIINIFISNKKENTLPLIIIPTIYILLLSAFIPNLTKNIFLIPIFEIFIRTFYITNIREEYNNKHVTLCSLASILLSLFAYNYFISKVDSVLPSPEEIRSLLWFLIIIFIYLFAKKTQEQGRISKIKSLEKKEEYITMEYAKFKTKYSNIIDSKIKEINILTYSLMIYENYQNSKIIRGLKSYTNHMLNKKAYYGIMQIPSAIPMTDEESIKYVIEDLEKNYKKDINSIINKYEEEKQKNIKIIYDTIVKFNEK